MSTRHLDALFADLPPRLQVEEVSDLLGVSSKGVYGWLRDGVIPGYRVGGRWIVLRDELKETLLSGANRATQVDDEDTSSSPSDS